MEAESALQRTSSKLMGLVGGARGGSGQRSRTASPATLPALVQTGSGSGGSGGGGLQTPTGSRVRAPSGLFVGGVVAGSAAGTGGAGVGAGGAGVGSETDRLLPAHPPTTPPPRVAGGALPFL